MRQLFISAFVALLVAQSYGRMTTCCKIDREAGQCGEVRIPDALVGLAVKFAGITKGGCVCNGYSKFTNKVVKVDTPIGVISSPVYEIDTVEGTIMKITKHAKNSAEDTIMRMSTLSAETQTRIQLFRKNVNCVLPGIMKNARKKKLEREQPTLPHISMLKDRRRVHRYEQMVTVKVMV